MASLKEKSICLLGSASGVDVNQTAGKVTIFTVPPVKSAVVTHVVVRAASTSLTTASLAFGFNANADDVITSETFTELTGATLYTSRAAKDGSTRGVAGEIFGCKPTIAEGGAATVTVDVFGYLY